MHVPKGTPLDSNPAHFSVVSYNLLAPLYVRPLDTRTGRVQVSSLPARPPIGQ